MKVNIFVNLLSDELKNEFDMDSLNEDELFVLVKVLAKVYDDVYERWCHYGIKEKCESK